MEPPPEHSLRGRAAATLAATLVAVVAFGLVGLDVEDHLRPTSLLISGTPSADGEALSRAHFGQSAPFALLLRGPAGAVERQGTGLTAALRRDRALTVISPWDGTRASKKLPHPPAGTPPDAPSRALLLVDSHVSPATAIDDTVPALDRAIDARVDPPVVAVQSGYATISRALQSESLAASERAELLAAPLLIVVLLLVFRSVVAAAIPLLFGAMTVFAARGILALLSSLMPIDALSLVVCTMMGLALGVDYSLLIVSRFREELKSGRPPAVAAAVTRRSAGRTTALAGSTLFVSIFLSAFLQAGTLLVSLATALVVVTGIAVLIAWLALPALLTLLGTRVNAWPIGRSRPGGGSVIAAAAASALRRPRIAALAVAVSLALLAIPALAFNTGSPGVDELPAESSARQDAETISEVAGPGWEAPFLLTVAARRGPITAGRRLRFLAQTQQGVERLPGVEAVIGPAAIAGSAEPLRPLATQLARNSSAPQLNRLRPRLRAASGAVSELRGGLAEAAAAGGLLSEGSARADGGAEALADGLDEAGAGGKRAASALARLASGSRRLVAGQREASASAYGLSVGLNTLEPNLTAQGLKRARKLAARLKSASSDDPVLRAAAHEATVLASVLAISREEIQRLSGQATALKQGLTRLHIGGRRLHAGSDRLSVAARRLGGGLDALGGGAQRLSTGLGRLHDGAGRLSVELARGFHRGYRLERALREGEKPLTAAAVLGRRLESLHRASPALFQSGFLPLAAIDGAGSVRRSLASEVLAVARGGTAARYLIVPEAGFNTPGSRRLGSRLHSVAAEIDDSKAFGAGVSGGAAVLNDYGDATKARLPLVIGAIVAITFLMLLALLRAPLLAALTVALNLLTVAAAIGVVTLACKIPAGTPLGGHPYIDTVGGAAIFGVTFGLSIDYAVFLLARMREHYRENGDNAAAISFGLDRTAGVITGAAAIMAAVFASFAVAPVATVSQMGLGLTVAILLDATVVRIVLLPALMLLIGKRVWRTPRWLERLTRPVPHATPAAATEAG